MYIKKIASIFKIVLILTNLKVSVSDETKCLHIGYFMRTPVIYICELHRSSHIHTTQTFIFRRKIRIYWEIRH